ncbi:hypothetical protein A3H90_00655 [Candidatus Peribacteria bacterium RIFCSPLOWO2_02_FULL_55_36]|nr:MAG: hypothetical protein A3H90_00655 [Candidatus Peribacteria bacterium RIFCSPLOWO2_02_FULL_55_36]
MGDVASTPYTEHVAKGQVLGLIESYHDGTFRPAQQITRAEAAKIIYIIMISNPGVNGYIVLPTHDSSSPGMPE